LGARRGRRGDREEAVVRQPDAGRGNEVTARETGAA